MPLILLDGMEDRSSWTIPTSSSPSTTAPARNGNGQSFGNVSTQLSFPIPPASESDTVVLGCAMRFSAIPTTTASEILLMSDAGATTHIILQVLTDGSVAVRRSPSTNLAVSAAGVIPAATWVYVELQAKLHDTLGTVNCRVNGVSVASASGVDTKNLGSKTTFDSVMISGPVLVTMLVDDLYLQTGTEAFFGDIKVETLYPNGDGSTNQWLGSDGNSASNWQLVDEVTPDPLDYVGSATAGQQDLYTLTDLVSSSGTIIGVCHAAYMARTDSVNPRSVRLVNRRTADTKGPIVALPNSYTPVHLTLTSDPDALGAWTIANVNALQSGVELVS